MQLSLCISHKFYAFEKKWKQVKLNTLCPELLKLCCGAAAPNSSLLDCLQQGWSLHSAPGRWWLVLQERWFGSSLYLPVKWTHCNLNCEKNPKNPQALNISLSGFTKLSVIGLTATLPPIQKSVWHKQCTQSTDCSSNTPFFLISHSPCILSCPNRIKTSRCPFWNILKYLASFFAVTHLVTCWNKASDHKSVWSFSEDVRWTNVQFSKKFIFLSENINLLKFTRVLKIFAILSVLVCLESKAAMLFLFHRYSLHDR